MDTIISNYFVQFCETRYDTGSFLPTFRMSVVLPKLLLLRKIVIKKPHYLACHTSNLPPSNKEQDSRAQFPARTNRFAISAPYFSLRTTVSLGFSDSESLLQSRNPKLYTMMTTKAAMYTSMAAPVAPMVKRHGSPIAYVDVKKSQIATPVGPLSLETSKDGLRAAYFDSWWEDHTRPEQAADTAGNGATAADAMMREAKAQVQEYFTGIRKEFTIPLSSDGTSFQKKAWAALAKIPYGETICYEEQAISMGEPTKARAVGAANAKNPICLFAPCHRVIAKGGGLCGYAGGVQIKQYLIDFEAGRLHG